jgi:adenosylhomocysteine nucleosidase
MIGIVCALPQEAAAFRPGQGTDEAGPQPLRRFDDAALITCGIGKVNASIAATRLIVSERVRFLLVVGTAGALTMLDSDCFLISAAVQGDYGAVHPAGFVHYAPGAWPIGDATVEAFAAAPLPLALPRARIVSGDAFVACPDHAGRLRDGLKADLVDMETAAVAQVAHLHGVPWAAIKATTDSADDPSGGEFTANLVAAAGRAATAAQFALANGL